MFSVKHTKARVLVVFGTLALLRFGAEAQGQERVVAAEIAQGARVTHVRATHLSVGRSSSQWRVRTRSRRGVWRIGSWRR